MAKNNKGKQPERTPQENEQIQDILAQYNQIAKNLTKSRNEEQIENALSSIFELSEAAQIGLLKALAKEHSIPAADIALAVNTYAPIKEIRKEARRSLIQLEGSNTYPEWTMPSVMSLSDIIGMDDAFNEFDDEDDDDEILDGENVIERFLRYWGQRDFELAYDLLTTNSPLKEGRSREEWAARRQTWATEAELDSDSLKVDVGYTLSTDIEDLPDDLEDEAEELDAFWSVEMKDVPGSRSIPELPTATITLQATGRHWFWANYTFLMEGDTLHIHSMRDMGAEALQLSTEEVDQRLQEITKELQAMSEALAENKRKSENSDEDEVEDDIDSDDSDEDDESGEDEDEDEFELDIDELRWFTRQSLHYCDALIAHPPTEDNAYEGTAKQAVLIEDMERVAAYYTIGVERLPEARGEMLRSLGIAYTHLAAEDVEAHEFEEEMEDEENTISEAFVSRYIPLAENAFREALATDNDFTTYILLAEILFRQNNRLAEAKTLFDQAQEVAKSPQDKASIEIGRARIARLENRPEEALVHFQNAIDAESDLPGIWYHMGELQLSLSQKDAAEESFLKSIEVDPTVTDAYSDLATLYIEQDNEEAALHVLEQGMAANPLEVDIKAALAMLYISKGDFRKAEELIEEAEELDPELELVDIMRQVIDLQKLQMQQQQLSANSTPNKSKKRR